MKKYILIAIFCICSYIATAQDTEAKDICDSVTVYYKAKLNNLNSEIISYRLERQLKQVQTIRDLKINPHAGHLTFNVNTCIHLTENQLKKLIIDAGAIPLEIKYSRKQEEIIEEGPLTGF